MDDIGVLTAVGKTPYRIYNQPLSLHNFESPIATNTRVTKTDNNVLRDVK